MSPIRVCVQCGSEFLGAGDRCCECRPQALEESGPTPLEMGRTFHGLEILEKIGRGGQGVVYKARQIALDRVVAVKILTPEQAQRPTFQERFEREAKVMASLSHPNLVAVYDFGKEEDFFFLVMEYVDGASLREAIQRRPLPLKTVVQILHQMCRALEYAHGEGVVHRDIKPENVLIDKHGRLRIMDFGLAKILDLEPGVPRLTATIATLGTMRYMAPEQMECSAGVDHRADIYSTGVILYELLTGEIPMGRFALPSEKAAVPPALDPILLRALEKDPARRYRRVADLRADIERVTMHRDTAPPRIEHAPAKRLSPTMRGLLLSAGGLALLLLVSLGARYLFPSSVPLRVDPPPKTDPPPKASRHPLYEKLSFGPDEGPLGRRPIANLPPLPENPFLAVDEKEAAALRDYLATLGFDLRECAVSGGYVAQWPGCGLIAVETARAEEFLRQTAEKPIFLHSWSCRKSPLVIVVFGRDREERTAFLDLVRRTQEKLGVSPEEPELPIDALLIAEKEIPTGWSLSKKDPLPIFARSGPGVEEFVRLQRHHSGLVAAEVRAAYCALFERKDGEPEVWLSAVEFRDEDTAVRREEAARTKSSEKEWREVLRARRTVVVLSSARPAEPLLEIVMRRVGHANDDFPHPRPDDLPKESGKVVREDGGGPEVARLLELKDLPPNAIGRALHLRFETGDEIAILEVESPELQRTIRESLSARGRVLAKGRWLCCVASSSPRRLDALEAMMARRLAHR